MEKFQKHAIEKSYEANKDFLKSFETFQKHDVKDPKKHDSKAEDKKSYTLIASTLHPKKVLKEEQKKEKKREEELRKKAEEEEEIRGLKRKREWEDENEQREREEQLKREKSERRKKEKEERRRLEREEKKRKRRTSPSGK